MSPNRTGEGDWLYWLYLLDPAEYVPPADKDRIQYPKRWILLLMLLLLLFYFIYFIYYHYYYYYYFIINIY
jgi:hypothetical protein